MRHTCVVCRRLECRSMTRSRVPAIALGYQGFGNVGDEAILAGIERLLAPTPMRVRAVIAGDRAPVPACGDARRITSRRLLPTPGALRELRRGKVLLVTGGGLIHDHWPVVIPRYAIWSVLARSAGLRIAWIGVGVGPIRRPWQRRLAARAVAAAGLLTVRDQASAEWLERLLPNARAVVIPDPAFFLESPPAESSGGGLGLIVRPPVPGDAPLAGPLLDALAGVAATHCHAGRPVAIVTMERQFDAAFASAVADRVESAAGVRPGIAHLPLDPDAALGKLARFDAIVSVRMHGLILAALARVPCVPVVYDDKVAATASRLGLDEVGVPLHEASGALLAERLDEVATGVFRRTVQERVTALRAEAAQVSALLSDFANG